MTFNSLTQIQTYLEQKRCNRGIDLGLKRMETACALLGNPEKQIQTIHIAGSNGKGSTVQFVKELLIAHGYRIGTFTSPQQMQITDQITIGQDMISDEDFIHFSNEICEKVTNHDEITEFEWYTLVAFLFFAKKKPDFVVIETGMGGRLDATNVITPLISVITNVSLEHTQYLGNTCEEIANEKAGIIKQAVPVVIGRVSSEILAIFKKMATINAAPLYAFHEHFSHDFNNFHKLGEYFDFFINSDGIYKALKISLHGIHQVDNATVAIMTLELLAKKNKIKKLSNDKLQLGFERVKWPGRFEIVSQKPLVILDGAHNPDGVRLSLEIFNRKFTNYNIVIVFSCFKDKDVANMIAQLDKKAHQMIFTEMKHERGARAEDLFALSHHPHKIIQKDLSQIKLSEKSTDLTLFIGSLELVRQVRETLF